MPEGEAKQKGGLRFTPEVRGGDILQIAGVLIAAFAAWQAMGERVSKVEERQVRQAEATNELRENVREIRMDVKETNVAIRILGERAARKGI